MKQPPNLVSVEVPRIDSTNNTRMVGFVEPKKRASYPDCLIGKEQKWAIRHWIGQDPFVQLSGLKERLLIAFGIKISISHLYQIVRGLRFSHKKIGVSPFARNHPSNVKTRMNYAAVLMELKELSNAKFFYIDESSFSSSMRHNYGFGATGDKDCNAQRPAVRSQAFSMIALLAPHGIDVYQMIRGSHNSQSFLDFITLVKKLVTLNYPTGNNIIILDNCGIHRKKEIQDTMNVIDPATWRTGTRLGDRSFNMLFLPTYSPFLNPIEEVFSWMKRGIKTYRPKNQQELFEYIKILQHNLPRSHVKGYYQHADSFLPACRAGLQMK